VKNKFIVVIAGLTRNPIRRIVYKNLLLIHSFHGIAGQARNDENFYNNDKNYL